MGCGVRSRRRWAIIDEEPFPSSRFNLPSSKLCYSHQASNPRVSPNQKWGKRKKNLPIWRKIWCRAIFTRCCWRVFNHNKVYLPSILLAFPLLNNTPHIFRQKIARCCCCFLFSSHTLFRKICAFLSLLNGLEWMDFACSLSIDESRWKGKNTER